ncbi:MAG: signal recognition particle-docking protein FtsY [Chthoniobacterales bacterium]|nr:signal recognition particle-docking protein FtsY [Chthoniobacterales bacterium]
MGFLTSLLGHFRIGTGESVDWDQLEATLFQADLGSGTVASIMRLLREKKQNLDADTITQATRQEIGHFLPEKTTPLVTTNTRPIVIFLVGVNGTGKTTSAAKLAYFLKNQGHSVLLAAADTFRAAAIEQLSSWGQRLGVEVVKSQYGGDPAALCHDALAKAIRLQTDYLICDTAGRLHTKSNLMEELAKIKRTVRKLDPEAPHHVLLVVDTTTGSNAVVQAKEFHSAVTLTGLIITKIDGSGKGGVAVSIAREIGITPLFLGTGEGISDFEPFERNRFLERFL